MANRKDNKVQSKLDLASGVPVRLTRSTEDKAKKSPSKTASERSTTEANPAENAAPKIVVVDTEDTPSDEGNTEATENQLAFAASRHTPLPPDTDDKDDPYTEGEPIIPSKITMKELMKYKIQKIIYHF